MKLSVITDNDDFLGFLETRTSGMQVLNRYRTLTDERELTKFNDDFNHVDVFLFLDFQDLSKEFKEFLDYLHKGKSYFLNTEEILLITYKDPKLSPTPELEKNLQAIEAYMDNLKYNLRVVRLDSMKFQDIYKSLTSSDNVRDNAPRQLIKYKVTHNSEGITVPPKRKKLDIVPDKMKGKGSVHKIEDLQSAQSLENTIIHAPEIVEPLRTEKNFKDFISISVMDTTTVFVTGLRYSGKTSIALECAKELEEQNLTSTIIDLTARKDLRIVNKRIKCELGMLRGLTAETSPLEPVLGVQVHQKVYTPTFLTNVLKEVSGSRALAFCEVDPEDLTTLYKSFRGNKTVLLVVPNNVTMLRDTIKFANTLDFHVVPVINNSYNTELPINKQGLRDSLVKSRPVFDNETLPDLVGNLLR